MILYLIYSLWYFGILCYIFPHVERALVLCSIFLLVKPALVLWYFLLYFSACGSHFGIVGFRVRFFHVWKALWYCGILCYIFPRVERTLVLCNLELYFSACGTRSSIVKFVLYIFACVVYVLYAYCL